MKLEIRRCKALQLQKSFSFFLQVRKKSVYIVEVFVFREQLSLSGRFHLYSVEASYFGSSSDVVVRKPASGVSMKYGPLK